MIDYNELTKKLVPHIGWPTSIEAIVDVLHSINPKIDKKKLIKRVNDAWESEYFDRQADEAANRELLDDHLPY